MSLAEEKDRSGNGGIRLTSFHIEDTQKNILMAVRSGMDLVFVFIFNGDGIVREKLISAFDSL